MGTHARQAGPENNFVMKSKSQLTIESNQSELKDCSWLKLIQDDKGKPETQHSPPLNGKRNPYQTKQRRKVKG